jgi:LCP family protein required for cell wall assembly
LGTLATLLVMVVGLGSVAAWTKARIDGIERADVDVSLLDEVDDPDDPVTFLVVGTDQAAGNRRADTVVVVRLDPQRGTLRLLSVPRDLYTVVGGTPARLSSALATGGPDLLISTVERSLGLGIDHYIEVGFAGFVDLVDVAGGIDVRVDTPLRDTATGLELGAGCNQLDGNATLALFRARRIESFTNERWVSDPTGDVGRMARQAAAARLAPDVLRGIDASPFDLARLVDVASDHVALDPTITASQLLGWATFARDLDQSDIATATLPTHGSVTEDGAQVLELDEGGGPAAVDFLRGHGEITPEPGATSIGLDPC